MSFVYSKEARKRSGLFYAQHARVKNFFQKKIAETKKTCRFAKQNNNDMKKIINHNGIEIINLDSIRSAKYHETIERLGEHTNTCFLCGKPTAKNTFVHLSTSGHLVPLEIDETEMEFLNLESQGCFPIGSECSKKVGKKFILNIR